MPKCTKTAKYRYTWPGKDEAVCCGKHGSGIQAVSEAIGSHMQMIPLSENDLKIGLECTSQD